MSDRPLITIGIPCFNAARWLRQCIQSALEQDWNPKEVIVVDDGSTDESPEIIRSFGGAIRAFLRPHSGGNHARNLILREARGAWIQFLDADDYLLPQKISCQLAEAGNPEAYDVLAAPVWREDYSRDCARSVSPDLATQPPDPCRQILRFQALQTNGGLWRKEALARIGGWDEGRAVGQDTDLYCRALIARLRIKWTPSPNVVYRYHWSPQSISRLRRDRNIQSNLDLALRMMDWMRQEKTWTPEIQAECSSFFFRMLRDLAEHDLPAACRWHRRMRRARLWQPADIATQRWAPATYAAFYRWLGFGIAEGVARLVRREARP